MASPPSAGLNANNSGVRKCGYLKKQKHGHRRFFVLKTQGEGYAARLEYYESEKKWKNKAAAKRVIALDSCLNIHKRADAKHKHLIALYARDEYFAVAADSEQEQDGWFRALTGLMNEGRRFDGAAPGSASSLVGFDEANYGTVTPVSAAYKEVWQVNLKSRGLGQSRNLTGVYRLCLSSRTVSFVKLNSEVASVSLQLMNIRRCGHSDSFFFIEVGRSAATGPGELWMQTDDSVVAQNIHETILEAMKAMKELSEFRPRSKSQSSGTNPISVPTRRHLNNLPPSQTGLAPRRARTDSMAATSPVTKFTSCRNRTASEGDGTMARPLSVSGSPVSTGANRTHLSRSNTVTARPCRTFESPSLKHSKSMCMSVCQSPPPATSPVSLSSGSGNASNLDSAPRPASCTASVAGSPSDAGFISCDECGSSPGDVRHLLMATRSVTPESFTETPPSREGSDLNGYMIMEKQSAGNVFVHGHGRRSARLAEDGGGDAEKAYRKRTCSLTMPLQKRGPSRVSSASLDECTLMRATFRSGAHLGRGSHATSPKVAYPEDYGDVEIGSLRKSPGGTLGDDGYMPMTPGVAPLAGKTEIYMPMSTMCVSAPKQIINPRTHPLTVVSGYRTTPPSSCSLDDGGYMRMLCGSRFSVESSDGKLSNSEYLNMSPVDPCMPATPPDYFPTTTGGTEQTPPLRQPCAYGTLPRCCKLRQGPKDSDQYVLMSLQAQRITEELVKAAPKSAPAPPRQGRVEGLLHRARTSRPTRLPLDSLCTLPSMNEHPLPPEPKSPGEYINIDFGRTSQRYSPPSSESPASSLGSSGEQRRSPLSDYTNVNTSTESPKVGDVAPFGPLRAMPGLSARDARPEEHCHLATQVPPVRQAGAANEDYTEMTFAGSGSPPPPTESQPTRAVRKPPARRPACEANAAGPAGAAPLESFLLAGGAAPPVDPDRGAKVIRADPQGRRRHSSETFSSTTTVTPVFPSFARDARHGSASVENVSALARKGEGSEEQCGSPMCRETSAGFQNGLDCIALSLMDERRASCDALIRFRATRHCKGGISVVHAGPYAGLGFKDTATAVKD
ncbi:LOW QUALITY PROTEIN: insulin receptor substrate 2 [Electrophorus electricus]|uniref:LOW QUALITY PROTEIN: insulin receptor substrate 2 n=1 Tax=Electrophorus electricus TaxID=8005 RepID=UPI0015D02585|nr:LOW QUALITY PROTEIN: insulin receptor substrate 2 [Electrophorus electricus]